MHVCMCVCRRAFGRHGWNVTFAINWVIFVVILVFGGGFGIWAAIKGQPSTFVQKTWGSVALM